MIEKVLGSIAENCISKILHFYIVSRCQMIFFIFGATLLFKLWIEIEVLKVFEKKETKKVKAFKFGKL